MTEKEKKTAIDNTELGFKNFCITNQVKYKSKQYYQLQSTYFNGAICVLGEIPPKWGVSIISNREIIEDYKQK